MCCAAYRRHERSVEGAPGDGGKSMVIIAIAIAIASSSAAAAAVRLIVVATTAAHDVTEM